MRKERPGKRTTRPAWFSKSTAATLILSESFFCQNFLLSNGLVRGEPSSRKMPRVGSHSLGLGKFGA